jgi:hypothetical protein
MSNTATNPKRKAAASSPGVIRADEMYLVDEARRRLRLGEWAWRQWRRDGLCVLRVSGRAFITGSAIIEFIEQHGREPETNE